MECCTIQPPSADGAVGVGDSPRSARVGPAAGAAEDRPAPLVHAASDAGLVPSTTGDRERTPTTTTDAEGGTRKRLCRKRGPPYRANPEALGWALDAVPRGAALMGAAVFVSTALLNLAKEAAGCDTGPDAAECHGKVYGMRPTSLLTSISLVVGIVCALLMPLVGSVVDHTAYRRAAGRISGASVSVLVLVQIFISSRTWFFVAISQIFLAFSYSVHLCVALAYLPELTDDKKELMRWNASFTVSQYLSSVVFLAVMVGAISLLGYSDDSVASARLSQGLVFVLTAAFFGYAWTTLFQAREASQQVPEGSTLVTAGFRKIYRTSRIIWRKHRAIKWLLLAVAFSESAVAAFVTIGITFMTDRLHFSSAENGVAILILLVSSIPGTQIATVVSNRWNPIRSLQLCLAVWIVNTSLAAAVLTGPGQQAATYAFAAVWGAATGWVYPTERSLYCSIIPPGQDGELMGMYLCSCQILSWMPPLVFTALNEAGVSMNVGVASLNLFWGLAFCVLFLVGSYDEAVEHGKNFVPDDDELSPSSSSRASGSERGGGEDTVGSDVECALVPDNTVGDSGRSSGDALAAVERPATNSINDLRISTFADEPALSGEAIHSKKQ